MDQGLAQRRAIGDGGFVVSPTLGGNSTAA